MRRHQAAGTATPVPARSTGSFVRGVRNISVCEGNLIEDAAPERVAEEKSRAGNCHVYTRLGRCARDLSRAGGRNSGMNQTVLKAGS